jgi:hypothetical protein
LGISLSDFADYGSKPSTSMDKFAVSSNQVEDDEIEYIGIGIIKSSILYNFTHF